MSTVEIYSPRQLASVSGWPERRIRDLILNKEIKHIKIGGHYYLPADAITDYVERNMVKPWEDNMRDQNSFSKECDAPRRVRQRNQKTSTSYIETQKHGSESAKQQALQTLKKLKSIANKD